jgi:hypothetical protein
MLKMACRVIKRFVCHLKCHTRTMPMPAFSTQGLFCCREWGLTIKLSLFIAKVEKASIAHWKEKTKNIAALKG